MASLTLKQLFQFPADVEDRLKGKTFVGIDFGTSTGLGVNYPFGPICCSMSAIKIIPTTIGASS